MSIQWPLVLFTLLTGTGAGSLIFIGLAEVLGFGDKARKSAGWVAAGLIVAGGLCSMAHLGQPANVMSAISNLGSLSGISIELILLAISTIVAVLYALVARSKPTSASKALGVVVLIVGLVFIWALGSSYMIGSRPAWSTVALPFGYFGSGLALGGFLYLVQLVLAKDSADDIKKVGLYVLVAAAVEVVAFLIFGVAAGQAALADNGILFWAGVIIIGGVVPLIAAFLVWKHAERASLIYAGLAGALLGGLAFRALMWAVGNPAIANLFDVASQNRGLYPF
ncbi:MAG: dimethyl sulfoxide reductase anchor subunit [Coriobacteriales bacterium]|nr:dimethyl sulfoxide reductase anchor subunit [Coriobacteriales bacterium]